MTDNAIDWVAESSGPLSLPMKRKRQKPKKLEFIRWGSKPLIKFLEFIGKDTSKPLNRFEVTSVINEYVNAKNLTNPEKKKQIMCDESLVALFGKRLVSRIKIYDLLEIHFTENQDSSEDNYQYSSEEQDYGVTEPSLGRRPSCQNKISHDYPSGCSAAICSENIKLVYLRKTLLLDLLKARECFSDKAIGSFVRIKSDPNDYLQKNCFQLQQVVGVRMISEAGRDDKVYLQLSNRVNDIPVEKLSDGNFSEEECEDLRERVKAGLLKWPTFVELEAKASMLHKDIMKHWIPRQISHLQNLIDRANEKGWRKELFDYLEQRQLLEKSSEQERLIAEIPKVIVDKLEPQAPPLEMGEGDSSSPESFDWEAADNYYSDDAGTGDMETPSAIIKGNLIVSEKDKSGITTGVASKEAENGPGDIKTPSAIIRSTLIVSETDNSGIITGVASKEAVNGITTGVTSKEAVNGDVGIWDADCQNPDIAENGNAAAEFNPLCSDCQNPEIAENGNASAEFNPLCSGDMGNLDAGCQNPDIAENGNVAAENGDESSRGMLGVDLNDYPVSPGHSEREVKLPPVIELSDDDGDEEFDRRFTVDDSEWQYLDPQGTVQGPFPLTLLKGWYECNYFTPDFMVWQKDQRQDQAILLVELLRGAFPSIRSNNK